MRTVLAEPIPEAAAGPAFHTVGFWLVIGGISVVVLVESALRVIPEHERVVVSRFGRVVRVGGPRVSWRIPGLERLTTVSLHPVYLPLVVSVSTRDGVPVRLIATAVCRITDPALSTLASPDPLTAATAALEGALGRETTRTDIAGLLAIRERLESSIPGDAATLTGSWGVVDVVELRVTDIETRLTTDLLRSVHRPTRAGDR